MWSRETRIPVAGTDGTMSTPTDHTIIAESMAAPERFEVIFDRHFGAVHRYLRRRIGGQLADDLAAETFAVAFARRASCAGDNALPWLYGIATNCVRRHRRTELRQLAAYARTGGDPVSELDQDAIAERLDANAEGPRLAGALAALPARQRDALLLFALADLHYDEVAQALGVPIGTVRTWLHRARVTTQRHLDGSSLDVVPPKGVPTDG